MGCRCTSRSRCTLSKESSYQNVLVSQMINHFQKIKNDWLISKNLRTFDREFLEGIAIRIRFAMIL